MDDLTLPQKVLPFYPPAGHLVSGLTVNPFPRSLTKKLSHLITPWKTLAMITHEKHLPQGRFEHPNVPQMQITKRSHEHLQCSPNMGTWERQDVHQVTTWTGGRNLAWHVSLFHYQVIFCEKKNWKGSWILIVWILKWSKVIRPTICFKKIQLVSFVI